MENERTYRILKAEKKNRFLNLSFRDDDWVSSKPLMDCMENCVRELGCQVYCGEFFTPTEAIAFLEQLGEKKEIEGYYKVVSIEEFESMKKEYEKKAEMKKAITEKIRARNGMLGVERWAIVRKSLSTKKLSMVKRPKGMSEELISLRDHAKKFLTEREIRDQLAKHAEYHTGVDREPGCIREMFLNKRRDFLKKNFFSENAFPSLVDDDDFSYQVTRWSGWEEYGRKSYTRQYHSEALFVPKNWAGKITMRDGLPSLEEKPIPGGFEAVWLERGRGVEVSVARGWIAVFGNVSYHSSKSLGHAISGLQRKVALDKVDLQIGLTMESKINRRTFSKITGACLAGINSWCAAHGLQDQESIQVKDLLALLTPDIYGYEKLLSVVTH